MTFYLAGRLYHMVYCFSFSGLMLHFLLELNISFFLFHVMDSSQFELTVFNFVDVDGLYNSTNQAKGWQAACNRTLHGRYLALCKAVKMW